ncbi:MAG TPA: ATP synthase F1 subunit delta [Thermoanaerobaculia bacterium]|nr:ATP synthase F1 subunit delta [Thermoanaerobaculia bacterium]
MRIRRFARPYARAIMDVAASPEKANAIRAELQRYEEVRKASRELQEVYANPGIDAGTKIAITRKLAERMGLSELAVRVLEVLIRNHRINQLEAIVAALAAYVNEALGIAVAEVRTAKPLSDEEVRDLSKTLEKRTGRKVDVRVTTDPALIGGFVARIGSEIYDASVVGRIERFRESLS